MAVNLLFKLCNNVVDRCIHIAGGFFAANDAALIGDGNLNNVTVFFDGHGDKNLGILGKITFELCDFFKSQITQIFGNLNVFACNRDLHGNVPSFQRMLPHTLQNAAMFLRLHTLFLGMHRTS